MLYFIDADIQDAATPQNITQVLNTLKGPAITIWQLLNTLPPEIQEPVIRSARTVYPSPHYTLFQNIVNAYLPFADKIIRINTGSGILLSPPDIKIEV